MKAYEEGKGLQRWWGGDLEMAYVLAAWWGKGVRQSPRELSQRGKEPLKVF